jgi:hypothetical protein
MNRWFTPIITENSGLSQMTIGALTFTSIMVGTASNDWKATGRLKMDCQYSRQAAGRRIF